MENTNENFYYIKEPRKAATLLQQGQVLNCAIEQDVQIVQDDCCAESAPVEVPPHNLLNGLQGGTIYERYHLNKVQYDSIIASDGALVFNNGLSKTNGIVTLGTDQSDSTGQKGKLLTDLLFNRQDNNSVDNGSKIRVASRSILQSTNNANFEADSELSFSNSGTVAQLTSFSIANNRMSSMLTSQSLTQSASALINRRNNVISQGIQLTDDIGTVSNTTMLVTDTINLRGLEYAGVYYNQFTDRSLIDKGYLYSRIQQQPTNGAATFLVSSGAMFDALALKATLQANTFYGNQIIASGDLTVYQKILIPNYLELGSVNDTGAGVNSSFMRMQTRNTNISATRFFITLTPNQLTAQNIDLKLPLQNGTLATLDNIPKMKYGSYSGTGNGSIISFSFPHGFTVGTSPTSAVASFGADTPNANMVGFNVTWNTTNITITFSTAPSGGFSINWIAIQA